MYSQFLSFNSFLKDYGIWIAVALAIILIFVCLFFLLKKGKSKGRGKEEIEAFLAAIGGKENILEVKARGSRLSLSLQDYQKVDKEKLQTLGVSSFIQMSNKITLVIDKAEEMADKISSLMQN